MSKNMGKDNGINVSPNPGYISTNKFASHLTVQSRSSVDFMDLS